MEIRLRDFDVVAKNLIEANLERADAGAFAFALFHGRDDLLAVLAQIAMLVKLGVVAGPDDSRFGDQGGRFVGNGALQAVSDIGKFVNFLMKSAKQLAAADGGRRYEVFQYRELAKRFAQGHEFAWRR